MGNVRASSPQLIDVGGTGFGTIGGWKGHNPNHEWMYRDLETFSESGKPITEVILGELLCLDLGRLVNLAFQTLLEDENVDPEATVGWSKLSINKLATLVLDWKIYIHKNILIGLLTTSHPAFLPIFGASVFDIKVDFLKGFTASGEPPQYFELLWDSYSVSAGLAIVKLLFGFLGDKVLSIVALKAYGVYKAKKEQMWKDKVSRDIEDVHADLLLQSSSVSRLIGLVENIDGRMGIKLAFL